MRVYVGFGTYFFLVMLAILIGVWVVIVGAGVLIARLIWGFLRG